MAGTPFSSVDAAWLRMEDPTNLMMVTGVLMFEERLDPRRLREVIEERLLSFPRFGQRVQGPPLGIGTPVWVSDDRFDLDAHLHRRALPQPGDKESLEALVSDLMSTPLDFSKPLWQVHLVDYGAGSVVVARIHHCIADGIALIQVLLSLTDTTREPGPRSVLDQPETPAGGPWPALPRAVGRLAEAGLGLLRDPSRALGTAALGAAAAGTLAQLAMLPADPSTPLKGKLGVRKRAAWSEPISLAEVKAAGAREGATINDVLVAATAGGLRRYLVARGQDVNDLEIRVAVPVNLRPLDRETELGNQFGIVFLPLPIGVADGRQRVLEAKRRMDELKASLQPAVAMGVLSLLGYAPRRVQPLAVEFFGSKASAVLTNVPGPREQLYLAGSPLASTMFWVPQSGRLGLGISILSYNGQVLLGVASDAGLVPDPERIVSEFEADLAQLIKAPRPRKAPRRKRAGEQAPEAPNG
ncbi:MAG: wax ester/triacylglycerol synthase family O-acyltransferase [Candidatus Dormibacteraeota bacterium]|nr:wax ester/triacylglycerol synthase family O-acyltransferase [Candidatus Dormibacteraeota bacterium]